MTSAVTPPQGKFSPTQRSRPVRATEPRTVAVSSGGQSPALARTIREELEIYFSREYEQLAQLAAETRTELHKRSLHVPFETWRRALSGDVRQFLIRGEFARAKSHLLRELGVSL